MESGEDYLDVKLGDIIESKSHGGITGEPRVFLLLRDGKMYPKQLYWGQQFPFGVRDEVVVSVKKCYAKLLYRPEV